MDNWDLDKLNERTKRLDFFDFKLAQIAGFFFGIFLIKIFPFLRRVGFKKILILMCLSGARPLLKFFGECEACEDSADDLLADEEKEEV